MQAVELALAVLGLGEQTFDPNLIEGAEQPGEALLEGGIVGNLAADVAVHPTEIGLEAPNLPARPAALPGMTPINP